MSMSWRPSKRTLAAAVLVATWAYIVAVSRAQEKSADKSAEKADEVTLKVVKYDALKEEVLKHRGKVVFIDFWADFCLPCKKAFPHTVELSNKYRDKGLVVISVAVDSLKEEPEETKARALKFLRKQNATFTNFLLDEASEMWTEKLRSNTVPFFYLFDRQGKWTMLTEPAPAELDRLIDELVSEK